jgi:hypothetical protein
MTALWLCVLPNEEYLLVDRTNLLQFQSSLCKLVFLLGRCVVKSVPITRGLPRHSIKTQPCKSSDNRSHTHFSQNIVFTHPISSSLQLTREMMDSRINTSPVISSSPLDTTIAYNEARSSPACNICGDLDPTHMRFNILWNDSPADITIVDCEKTKDNCPSCALLWTISAPYRHLTVPHKTTAEIGSVYFWLQPGNWLWMGIKDPTNGYNI